MIQYFFISNWRPVTLNRLLSCPLRTRIKLKKFDRELIGLELRRQNMKPATGKRMVSLSIRITGRQKESDPDSHWKVLLDSLVKCGALIDDKAEYCELGTVRYLRSENLPGTSIILDDI